MSVSVTTWHNDAARTGWNASEAALAPAYVNSNSFGKLFSYPVQGQVYAQPLYLPNYTIPGKGTRDVLFVATENNDVYALDANSNAGANAGVLWHVNLGLAAAMPNSFFGNRYGPYHDLTPQVGITSTPVIDLATGTMYLDAFTNDVAGQNVYSHHVHALNLATGADKVAPVLVAASVNGNGVGGANGVIPFVATQHLQRPAITLLNGTVYVAFSSYADTNPYHGWVLGYNASSLALTSVFNTTPNLLSSPAGANAGEGGIWQGGAGLASDGTNLFLMVGNGDYSAALGDWGDSVLKLSPDPTSTPAKPNIDGYGLKVGDSFTPYNQQALSDADQDLGSGGGIVLPDQPGAHPHLYIGSGKQGMMYLVDRDAMGGFNATADPVVQEVNMGHGVFGSPAYANGTVYFHPVGDVLRAHTLTNGKLSAAPSATGATSYSWPGATPSVSSDGAANGIVWDMQISSSTTPEVLHAYDATTLTELYNSGQNAARDGLGVGVKFVTPTIADGHVFVGTSGQVSVYGLLNPPTTAPAAPTALAASGISPSQAKLTWTDNASNETVFEIERSTDNVSFTQVGLASANATSYVDNGLSAGTLYYYRLRASNTVGASTYVGPASATTPTLTAPVDVYHFDEGTGTSTVDSVSANNGTFVGNTKPAWVAPGKIGAGALSFTGDGVAKSTTPQSAVQTTGDLAPVLGNTATLTAWIKTTQVGNNTAYAAPAITGVEAAASANDVRWGYLDASGHIGVNAGNGASALSTSVINDGAWHSVAFTRDATTGVEQVYVDGVLQATASGETGIKTSIFKLIGAQTAVATDGTTFQGATYLNAQLDEVRIYNKVLSGAELQGIAIAPSAPTLTGAAASTGPVVHLTWTNPSSFAQNIEVWRKVGAAGIYALLTTLAAGVSSYDDPGVAVGTQYFYKIRATDLAGASAFSNELNVTPPRPTVLANRIFYNGSIFDGNNGSSNLTDTDAIDPAKQGLLPGQTPGAANITGYAKGLNGVIIDVADLTGVLTDADFTFRAGNTGTPANWALAPDPTYINVYPGRGPNGSTQITIIWDDGAIRNEWLQVTMNADAVTNLAAADGFYFGNIAGDINGDGAVNFADFVQLSNTFGVANATVATAPDLNHDGKVDFADFVTLSNNFGLTLATLTATATSPDLASANVVADRMTIRPATRLPRNATPSSRATSAQSSPAAPIGRSSVDVDARHRQRLDRKLWSDVCIARPLA